MKKYVITVNGTNYEVEVNEVGGVSAPAAPVASSPAPKAAAPAAPKAAPAAAAKAAAPVEGATSVEAPLPGTIWKLKVKEGDQVTEGQLLLILEAMKMENEIFSPAAGTVASIKVAEGASVNSGDILVEIA